MAVRYKLRQHRLAVYKNRRGVNCPICFKDNLCRSQLEHEEAGALYQPVHCEDCGASWVDAYKLDQFFGVELGPAGTALVRKQKQNWNEGKPIDEL